jgi:hypothetical protein
MGAAGPSSTVAYSLLGAIKVVEIDAEVGLAKQAGCEACAEYAADPLRHASSSRQRAVRRLRKQREHRRLM